PHGAASMSAPATTELYALSLHDALPIFTKLQMTLMSQAASMRHVRVARAARPLRGPDERPRGTPAVTLPKCQRPSSPCQHSTVQDRKSTRLNSSHVKISYAVFCLKKKST